MVGLNLGLNFGSVCSVPRAIRPQKRLEVRLVAPTLSKKKVEWSCQQGNISSVKSLLAVGGVGGWSQSL